MSGIQPMLKHHSVKQLKDYLFNKADYKYLEKLEQENLTSSVIFSFTRDNISKGVTPEVINDYESNYPESKYVDVYTHLFFEFACYYNNDKTQVEIEENNKVIVKIRNNSKLVNSILDKAENNLKEIADCIAKIKGLEDSSINYQTFLRLDKNLKKIVNLINGISFFNSSEE
jgi:hypothetical protein